MPSDGIVRVTLHDKTLWQHDKFGWCDGRSRNLYKLIAGIIVSSVILVTMAKGVMNVTGFRMVRDKLIWSI